MAKLKIEDRHLKIVLDILKKYPYDFYAFGSRAHGNPRKLSDLDLCYYDNIPLVIKAKIEENFENSNLPYTVDLVDYNIIDNSFKNNIKNDLVLVSKGFKL